MKRFFLYIISLSSSFLILSGSPASTETPVTNKSATTDSEIVFSAPPRESPSVGARRYQPIANYLSQVIGRKVVYKHPRTWGAYRTEMLKGDYDIVFDGPHFNSYRAERMKHNILAKIPIEHQFVIIVNKNNTRAKNVSEMAGRTFCTHAPPNLGTLSLLNHFQNPSRQPAIINTKGWKNIYRGVASGRCEGGILPMANLLKYDRDGKYVRALHVNQSIPNQAFSAGPRLSKQEQQRIASALVSDSASNATSELRSAYRVGNHFAPAKNSEYLGVSEFLKNEWGYFE